MVNHFNLALLPTICIKGYVKNEEQELSFPFQFYIDYGKKGIRITCNKLKHAQFL